MKCSIFGVLGELVMTDTSDKVVAMIQRLAVASTSGSKATDCATSDVLELEQQVDRTEILNCLIEQVRPRRADPDHWISWMDGGSFPTELNMTRPMPSSQRASRAIGSASRQAARAMAKVDAAKLALSNAEAERDAAHAVNAAQTHFAIAYQLVDVMRGVFAMGPAWTLMRAVSRYVPQDTAAFAAMTPEQQQVFKAKLDDHAAKTNRNLVALDFWCGDPDFENYLNVVIHRAINTFRSFEPERERSGVKRRSLKELLTSMRVTPRADIVDIIDYWGDPPYTPYTVPAPDDPSDEPF